MGFLGKHMKLTTHLKWIWTGQFLNKNDQVFENVRKFLFEITNTNTCFTPKPKPKGDNNNFHICAQSWHENSFLKMGVVSLFKAL